ncbi:MAG: glycosyltransferase [Planctomycetota bacterium]
MLVTFFLSAFPRLSETFILSQITGLIDRGIDVRVIASNPTNEEVTHSDYNDYRLDEIVTHVFPQPSPGRLALLGQEAARSPFRLAKSVRPGKFGKWSYSPKFLKTCRVVSEIEHERPSDVILAHFGGVGDLAASVREVERFDAPLAVIFHGSDMAHPLARGQRLYPRLKQWGDLHLPISDRWKNALIKDGFAPEKTMVHRVGVDVPDQIPNLERPFGDPVRLLSVSRFAEKKGLEFAIRAVGHLKSAGRRIHYSLVGGGELQDSLEALTDELDLRDVVEFVGRLPKHEVVRAMQSHDIFLCPSVTSASGDQEGIPTAIMESMASGLLVVSTRHSGIPELVHDGESGLLADERDSQGFAAAIETLIDQPELHAPFRQHGYQWVDQHFNIDRLNDRLVQRLERLAAGEPVE